jgi:hypothetical protein
MRGQRLAGDDGMVSAMMAVLAVGLLMAAGLAYDGGQIVAAQATARDLAANAARAGAQEIDLDRLRGFGEVTLDESLAARAASAYVASAGHRSSVDVDGDQITVTVSVRQTMAILPLPDRTIRATDTATAVTSDSDRG